MSDSVTTPNLEAPDAFYADLLSAHEKLGKEESDAFNARLILLLANRIGNLGELRQLLEAAKVDRVSKQQY
ncbi:hypothetical protein IWQ49_001307 [Labrenzia sp. EL_126]|nr:hypothetical protein [Labrenzia sp. EL_126]